MENKNQLNLLKNDNALDLLQAQKKLIMKKAEASSRPASDQLFDNCIDLEELAVIFRLALQAIRNWVALQKTLYVKIGKKWIFLKSGLQKWFIQKEESQWQ